MFLQTVVVISPMFLQHNGCDYYPLFLKMLEFKLQTDDSFNNTILYRTASHQHQ